KPHSPLHPHPAVCLFVCFSCSLTFISHREDCDFPPEVAHGYYEETKRLRVFIQNEVIYRCDKGYTLVGEAKLSCSSSRWTPEAPQCKALCPKPEIAHAKLSNEKDQYVQSEAITVQCDSGYELVGPQSVTCSESRTWYPELPKCEWVIAEVCEHVRKGRKIIQCLLDPVDVKMAMELYKLSLEIELLELRRDKEKKYTMETTL
uniref:Sushi domain-containing protein n=1 Tax=Neovison vison TaxID=452646 RepID=A0A8C7AY19_NEOVI